MPAQTPLDESLVLPVNTNFTLLAGLSEHQVLSLGSGDKTASGSSVTSPVFHAAR